MNNCDQCCGTCRYHISMPLDEWCCDNEDSDGYGLSTAYNDYYEEYEGRDTANED